MRFLNGVKTPGLVGKFSPTLLKSMVAGAISGTIEETMDAINDYRDDGKQSVGARVLSVGINTVIAGAGDALFTAASKGLANVKKLVNGKIGDVKVKEVEGTAKARAEIEGDGDFDLKEWEDMPVSGQIRLTPDGLRIMSIRDMKKFKSEMNANDVKVIIDKNGSVLPQKAVGGFNPNTGQIVLRPDASILSALHESFHAKQFRELGKEKYLKLSTLEKEEFVYNEIMMNKSKFNAEEIYEAQRYIFKLRNGQWPPPSWKGFDE
ncbi:zincin-like metallopeptidase toxin domain-containing protein [Paenibacillus sp. MMS20-IR301]|uniref:zincin-like metallopeptidase toxin domain-containing protein n=1 Tax=Paenibacillus sp. MMS20-IR301 TaxID=2895946 RepID=UPI0028E6A81D|nr:zincin-like metallopeptidase toxin domain-containing protein [Paenibacillus sp. MMS20-IR301]WNS41053.1 zincin-like metallopeptidase toxin domain-containing protein [Paenibacillus sp. MMS20-IR301]